MMCEKPARSGLFCCSDSDEVRMKPVKTDARPYKEPYNGEKSPCSLYGDEEGSGEWR